MNRTRHIGYAPVVVIGVVLLTVLTATAATFIERKSSGTRDCDIATHVLTDDYPYTISLAWASHQVITGEVIEERSIAQASAVLDYVVRVDGRVRGVDGDIVVIRMAGGVFTTCGIAPAATPSSMLRVGQRVLLFLHADPLAAAEGIHVPTGLAQGIWAFMDDRHVYPASAATAGTRSDVPHEVIYGIEHMSAELLHFLRMGDYPGDEGRPRVLVPLSEAPLGPGLPEPPHTP